MAIQDYFNQTCSWYTASSVDQYGDKTFGTASSIVGRLQLKKTTLKDINGVDVISDAVLYTKLSYNIKNRDRIDYTDSTGDIKRFEVIEVYEARNRRSLHHKKLLLKYAQV